MLDKQAVAILDGQAIHDESKRASKNGKAKQHPNGHYVMTMSLTNSKAEAVKALHALCAGRLATAIVDTHPPEAFSKIKLAPSGDHHIASLAIT